MTSLKKVKLGDIAEITTGFPFKGSGYSNLGIRVLRGENVSLGQLRWDTVKCWNHPFSDVEKYSLNEDDIVIGMDGSRVGRNKAQIKKNDLPLLLAQRVARVKTRFGYSQTLIAYIIKSPLFEKYVEKVQTGTSIPHISQTQIEDFKFDIITDYKTQCSIAEILSSLDDKIELNNKINQELESLAQLLFKRWFVDFEFPNENGEPYKSSGGEMVDSEMGEIPKGWAVCKIENILEVKGGTTPSTKEPQFWDGEFNWTSPRDLSDLKFPLLLRTDKKITSLGLSKVSSGLLPKGTLLLSSRAPIGYLAITEIETAINQGYIAINCKNGYSNLFMLNWLKQNMDTVIARANGSTFLEISKSNFREILIVKPELEIHDKYITQVSLMFESLKCNLKENEKLITIRDLLLPKLISGELQLNDN